MLREKDPSKVREVRIEEDELFFDPDRWICTDIADSHFTDALGVPGRFGRSNKVACIETGRGGFPFPAFS